MTRVKVSYYLERKSFSESFSKFYSLNYHLEILLYKNSVHSPIAFLNLVYTLESYFRYISLASGKMRNGVWLHLDNHLEKLLEVIFLIKIYIPNNEERYIKSLGVSLRAYPKA